MKCNKCGYDDSGSGDMAHVCQRPSFRYGEHPTSFGLFNTKQEPVAGKWIVLSESVGKLKELGWNDEAIHKANTPQRKPLSDEEYSALAETYTGADGLDCVDFGRAVARHYGIKE